MDTRDFVREVAKRSKVPREDVSRVLSEVVQYGIEILIEGDEFRLPGLGKFELRRTRRKRQVDSFKKAKGEIVVNDVPAKFRVHFKAYESAKHQVNEHSC